MQWINTSMIKVVLLPEASHTPVWLSYPPPGTTHVKRMYHSGKQQRFDHLNTSPTQPRLHKKIHDFLQNGQTQSTTQLIGQEVDRMFLV